MLKGLKLYHQIVGSTGLAKAIAGKITHSRSSVSIKRTDCKHPFKVRVPSTDVPTYKQVFVDEEYAFKASVPPGIIVDAGANIGLASIYFANRFPEAKIVAIEPEDSNYHLLAENVSPYPNIIPIQAALWHRDGELNLNDQGIGNWGFITEEGNSSTAAGHDFIHRVKAITIQTLMRDFHLPSIDILKMDIEGAEKEVFSDSSPWINKVNAIIVELHERMKTGCNRSFYCGSNGFDQEWSLGENVYLARKNFIAPNSTIRQKLD